jgi:CysZ protein
MRELAQGVRDVERGFAFLNEYPRLWVWVIAPAAITLLVLTVLLAGLALVVHRVVGWMTAHLPAWLDGTVSWASWLLTIIVVIALAAGAMLVFVAIVGMIAGPFCERLSEAVDDEVFGGQGPKFTLGRFLVDLVVGVIHGLRRLAIAVLGALLLIALSWVPVVGTFAALAVAGWLAAHAAAYDCYDAILARRALAYRHKLEYLRKHRSRTLGLGAVVAGLLLVPGVNLVALGVGAVGATLAVHDFDAEAEERLRLARQAGQAGQASQDT